MPGIELVDSRLKLRLQWVTAFLSLSHRIIFFNPLFSLSSLPTALHYILHESSGIYHARFLYG